MGEIKTLFSRVVIKLNMDMDTKHKALVAISLVGGFAIAREVYKSYTTPAPVPSRPAAKDRTTDLFSAVINARTSPYTIKEGTQFFPPEEAARKARMDADGLPYIPRRSETEHPNK